MGKANTRPCRHPSTAVRKTTDEHGDTIRCSKCDLLLAETVKDPNADPAVAAVALEALLEGMA